MSYWRKTLSADYQLLFRLINGFIVVAFASTLITLVALPHMTIKDIVVCILAFLPTGWGLLLVSIFFLTVFTKSPLSRIFYFLLTQQGYLLLNLLHHFHITISDVNRCCLSVVCYLLLDITSFEAVFAKIWTVVID